MRVNERPYLHLLREKFTEIGRPVTVWDREGPEQQIGPFTVRGQHHPSEPSSNNLTPRVLIVITVSQTPTLTDIGRVNAALRGTGMRIQTRHGTLEYVYTPFQHSNRHRQMQLKVGDSPAGTWSYIDADVLADPDTFLPDPGAKPKEVTPMATKKIKVEATPGHHEYVPTKKLVSSWEAVLRDSDVNGQSMHLYFTGPSGSGKTDGAKHLAERANLEFVKVDAAAMVDPESWFGTREIVIEDGVSVTRYNPSAFVQAIERECVLFIDEINRIKDAARNILLPLLDGTRQVTNPLTGQVVTKHPKCFVIMAGNVGFAYTGTYAVDPALTTRALTLPFSYLTAEHEVKVAMQETGCEQFVAEGFVRLAKEIRDRASKPESEIQPMSTREVLSACRLMAAGLDPDTAAEVAVINGASSEGGLESPQAALKQIWTGIRPLLDKPKEDATDEKAEVPAELRVSLDRNGNPVVVAV